VDRAWKNLKRKRGADQKVADLANQLQRQYELCRTHKEEHLRLSNELKTARIEKEARGEEIAKLRRRSTNFL